MSIKQEIITVIEKIEGAVEHLWKTEEPSLQSALNATLAAWKPVWQGAFGTLVMDTVTGLQSFAASNGGLAAAAQAFLAITAGAKAQGIVVAEGFIKTAIEVACQELKATAPTGPRGSRLVDIPSPAPPSAAS